MRIFLDANILFSGALPHSRMRAFLDFLCQKFECLTNAYAAEEARRNLELKFPTAVRYLDPLVRKCTLVNSVAAGLTVELPFKDMPIIGGAVAGNATHLLTGDEKDFGRYFGKVIEGVIVVSPKMLAEELSTRGLL